VEALRDVRIVVVECDSAHASEALADCDLVKEHVDARADAQAVTDDLREQLEAMRTAPPGAAGARLTGGAGPRVSPPPRNGAANAPTAQQRAEAARAGGVGGANLDTSVMHQVAIQQRSAILAAREGKLVEAIRFQRETVELCEHHALLREALVHRVVLGSLVLQAGELEKARHIFHDAEEGAREHAFPLLRVQSRMAVASIDNLLQRPFDAAQGYAEAGNLASQEGQVILAIESYRLAGQCLLPGHPEQAVLAFQRALDVANAAPDQARASSVPEAARDLAKVCRDHRLHAQAESLEAQALAYENAALNPPA
jgi:tetratricopeptide (TPR) repeat protein